MPTLFLFCTATNDQSGDLKYPIHLKFISIFIIID